MKRWHMCLYPQSSDHRPSVPLGLFCPVSEAHDSSWLERSREGVWHLLSGLVVWFLRMCGWVVTDLVLRWRNWGLVTCPTSLGLWEGLSCSLLPPDSPHDSLSRLSSGPCSWDLLCEELRLPKYLRGTPSMITGAPDLATHFPGGVVNPVRWDWGWVPRGLHLKWRSRLRG